MTTRRSPLTREQTDRGTVLILTLILTVVLALIVLALATYATTGLATSEVTDGRNESNAVVSAGLTWYLEELSREDVLRPDDPLDCSMPAPPPTAVPAGILPAGAKVEVSCTTVAEVGNHPTVELLGVATTANGTTRTVKVVAQVPRDQNTVQVRSWDVQG